MPTVRVEFVHLGGYSTRSNQQLSAVQEVLAAEEITPTGSSAQLTYVTTQPCVARVQSFGGQVYALEGTNPTAAATTSTHVKQDGEVFLAMGAGGKIAVITAALA